MMQLPSESDVGLGGLKISSTGFNPFEIEDSPDLVEASQGFVPAKTKKQKSAEELALRKKQKEEEIAKLPTKGNPPEFFQINYYDDEGFALLNSEQKKFVYGNYFLMNDPEDMVKCINWLHSYAIYLVE